MRAVMPSMSPKMLMMGARIYLSRDFGMCVQFLTRRGAHNLQPTQADSGAQNLAETRAHLSLSLSHDACYLFGIWQRPDVAGQRGRCASQMWQANSNPRGGCREHVAMSIFQASALAETLAFGKT